MSKNVMQPASPAEEGRSDNFVKLDIKAPHSAAGERRAHGKSLRERVPREAHAGWKAPRNRRDPVDLLIESNQGRLPQLIPIRFGRMMASPFTFYRGSAGLMAADLATTPASGLRVQACGDAHLLNFGGFATPERNVVFDINDLDETLPAPWEWDLKQLTASMVIAGRALRMTETDCAARHWPPCVPTASTWPTTPRCERSKSGMKPSASRT
jgi:hypothetical protein